MINKIKPSYPPTLCRAAPGLQETSWLAVTLPHWRYDECHQKRVFILPLALYYTQVNITVFLWTYAYYREMMMLILDATNPAEPGPPTPLASTLVCSGLLPYFQAVRSPSATYPSFPGVPIFLFCEMDSPLILSLQLCCPSTAVMMCLPNSVYFNLPNNNWFPQNALCLTVFACLQILNVSILPGTIIPCHIFLFHRWTQLSSLLCRELHSSQLSMPHFSILQRV